MRAREIWKYWTGSSWFWEVEKAKQQQSTEKRWNCRNPTRVKGKIEKGLRIFYRLMNWIYLVNSNRRSEARRLNCGHEFKSSNWEHGSEWLCLPCICASDCQCLANNIYFKTKCYKWNLSEVHWVLDTLRNQSSTAKPNIELNYFRIRKLLSTVNIYGVNCEGRYSIFNTIVSNWSHSKMLCKWFVLPEVLNNQLDLTTEEWSR